VKHTIIATALFIALSAPAQATDAVVGQTAQFLSYNSVPEACVRIAPLPSANYDPDDLADEAALCAIDIYSPDIALCPKIWSTSAAVVFYDISEGKFKDDRTGFQTTICAGGKIAKYVAKDQIARLKFSINQATTSATFTPSSLLYYHFSRYFGFTTTVPVAVWRSIDKSVLLNEVALGGQALSADQDALAMNHAAWNTLVAAIAQPESYEIPGSYGTAADFLTSDGRAAYGTVYDGGGTPYGPEMNGAVDDDTAEARYASFLQSPVVLALSTDLPLADAIAAGLAHSATPITPVQMAFWMREMAEIIMIDTLLSQQDRPSNIDYRDYFYWQENGKIKRKRMRDQVPGQGDIPASAVILKRSRLNDNDAAGRIEYDNHLLKLNAIAALRHFDAELYARLQALNTDFQAQGPIYMWLRDSLGLDESQVAMIVANTANVAQTLKTSMDQGRLRFDLDAEGFFIAATKEAQITRPTRRPNTENPTSFHAGSWAESGGHGPAFPQA